MIEVSVISLAEWNKKILSMRHYLLQFFDFILLLDHPSMFIIQDFFIPMQQKTKYLLCLLTTPLRIAGLRFP